MTHSLNQSLNGRPADTWAVDFCAAAGFPATPSTVQAIVSWAYAESGGGGGMFNPLNTTESIGDPGETWFNSFGPGGQYHVLNFPTWEAGIAANRKAIHNGYYPRVVAAFERGNDARTICDLITMSPWGTGPISLVGTPAPVTPPPAHTEVSEMQVIALEQTSSPAGRVPLVVWDPAHPNRVTLENGARLKGDAPTPIPHVRTWTPRKVNGETAIPAGVTGIGISHAHRGYPKGVIVLACTGGNTYFAEIP